VASPHASWNVSPAASWSAAEIPQGPSNVLERYAAMPESPAVRIASRARPTPPHEASFTLTASHAPSAAAARTSSGPVIDSSAATGVWIRRRTSASSGSVAQGCSTSSRSFSSSAVIRSTASSTLQTPLASRRSAGQLPIASRTAATRSRSSGRPTLTLKHWYPARRPSFALFATSSAGPAGRVLLTGIAIAPGSPIGRPSRRASRSSSAISTAASACGSSSRERPRSTASTRSTLTPS
jgi:hypothetical protein